MNAISGFGFPPKVTPGGTKTFDVQYTPTSGGAFSFNLSLGNNDSDEDPYNFTVSGTALAPEISVSSSEGGAIARWRHGHCRKQTNRRKRRDSHLYDQQ